ncbi:MAG: hypothetical protein ACYDHH_01900 [Solirubrobacteraceae bacterium]
MNVDAARMLAEHRDIPLRATLVGSATEPVAALGAAFEQILGTEAAVARR